MQILITLALLVIPQTIQVRVTGLDVCDPDMQYRTETMDFKEYVKGVLPAEWGNDWHEESLKAGAMAVKMYAWTTAETKGYVWDCHWDQVYHPEWRTEATDKAVDDTWNYILVSHNPGKPIKTYYNAWHGGCLERGETNCMGQWDSLSDAVIGHKWQVIVMKYYEGQIVSTFVIDRCKPRIE